MEHPDAVPCLLVADKQGMIMDFPELQMAGMSNGIFFRPQPEDLIPLPLGSELFALPGRFPVGWDPETDEPVLLSENPQDHGPVQAVAAFVAPAHTAIYTSAYQSDKGATTLPLFAYTAVGWYRDRFWVAGFRSDEDRRQDADQYRQVDVERKTRKALKMHRSNRLIQHLGKCCLTYGCPAARNYFLGRWEAPLPTSPACNARCIGCISLQASGCCLSSQERITFVPSIQEIGEVAIPHLETAANPIVSFGQGCEGEPLLQSSVLEKSIRLIRSRTPRGTINLNSNSSLPDQVQRLAEAGLDSIRVSLNSVQETYYNRYYRPRNYRFSDVARSVDVMKSADRFVSLNYFVLPGFTDSPMEYEALCDFLRLHSPDFIQLRNLNMDPEWYLKSLAFPKEPQAIGIRRWLALMRKEFPRLRFGYFNPQVAPI